MTKSALRKFYKQKRKELSFTELDKFNSLIFNKLKNSEFILFQNFHIFLPIKKLKEVNTIPIIDFLLKQEKNVFIPKIENENLLVCEFKNFDELAENSLGILEPKNSKSINPEILEIVFIPMLICDKQGNRVGYGQGFYDRFLAKCSENCLKIGLNYFEPFNEISDVNEFDIPLDFLITPEKMYKF